MGKEKVRLNKGEYVFCSIDDINKISKPNIIAYIKERHGFSVIISKNEAIRKKLSFYFISAWITLQIDSTLDSVGLTSTFSKALSDEKISCNVIAGYHHDHVFVPFAEKDKAMKVLSDIFNSKNYSL